MALDDVTLICPSAEELSVIKTNVACDKCGAVFCSEASFRMHHLKVHERKNLEKVIRTNVRYGCPAESCKKSFPVYKYLKQHYLKVHAEKKFTCTECRKGFSTKSALEAHHRVCGIIYTCECSKSFSSYESLLTHGRRHSHNIPQIYSLKKKEKVVKLASNSNPLSVPIQTVLKFMEVKPTFILPKPTCEIGVQTEGKKPKRSKICRQTQTSEKSISKISAETQTSKMIRVRQVGKRKNGVHPMEPSQVKTIDDIGQSIENFLPDSPIIFEDLWEEKSTSGTQTSPEKIGDTFGFDPLSSYEGIFKSDPMLTEKTFPDKYSSIETQTEQEFCRSLFEKSEAQTSDSIDHIYSNMYTQTCDDFLPPDLVFSDIQTQTAWCEELDETTVTAETQTRDFKCHSSWFATQTNHMETQTDLLRIFDDLV